jgi:succinate dehydrogenase / fumarate reductase cytochrome b subunit
MNSDSRPLSPHLQIYKPQLTSVMSISHRATGMFLSLGALWLAYWLIAAMLGPNAFSTAQSIMSTWYGNVLLGLWSYALFYHLCNGIRHLMWDTVHGLELKPAYVSGYAVVVASLVLTALVWIFALAVV